MKILKDNEYIRKYSAAWIVVTYGRAIIATLLLVAVIITFTSIADHNNSAQTEEKPKVDELAINDEKALQKELTGFVPLDIPLEPALQEFIFGVASDYGLEGELVLALIEYESSFDENAIGDGGESYGLMQVQPKWYEAEMKRLKISKDELLDPYANVVVGVDVLAGYVERFGVAHGLVAYNAGPDDAIELQKQGVITEYAESVLYLYENL